MVASEQIAADFARCVLFSLWAHDCHGLLWWCAYDQGASDPRALRLAHVRAGAGADPRRPQPEAGAGRDRPLRCVPGRAADQGAAPADHRGGLRPDPRAGPVGRGLQQLRAGQAGRVRSRRSSTTTSRSSRPRSICCPAWAAVATCHGGPWQALLERVRNGATLYLSHNNCMLSPFGEAFGLDGPDAEQDGQSGRVSPGFTGRNLPGPRADPPDAQSDPCGGAGPARRTATRSSPARRMARDRSTSSACPSRRAWPTCRAASTTSRSATVLANLPNDR